MLTLDGLEVRLTNVVRNRSTFHFDFKFSTEPGALWVIGNRTYLYLEYYDEHKMPVNTAEIFLATTWFLEDGFRFKQAIRTPIPKGASYYRIQFGSTELISDIMRLPR